MKCKAGGCSNPVQKELFDHSLCLEHFLRDLEDRTRSFARQLSADDQSAELHQIALQFTVLAAAKIATIGIENPPPDQQTRSRLLNAMLLLAELRERLDKALARKSPS